jgi:hypothetical protein
VLGYTLLVFVSIAFEEDLEDAAEYLLIVELIVLSLFLFEISIKLYAFGISFLKD